MSLGGFQSDIGARRRRTGARQLYHGFMLHSTRLAYRVPYVVPSSVRRFDT